MSETGQKEDTDGLLRPFLIAHDPGADQVCEICQQIDFPKVLLQESGDLEIGTLAHCRNRHDCPMCRLVGSAFHEWCPDGNSGGLDLKGRVRCFISSVKTGKKGYSQADHCQLVLSATDRQDAPNSHNGGQIISHIDIVSPQEHVELSNENKAKDTGFQSLPLYSRRPVAPQCDFSLLRSWFQECETGHQHSHIKNSFDRRLIDEGRLRALDVTTLKMTTLGLESRYVAFSYVCEGVAGIARTARERTSAEVGAQDTYNFSKLPSVIQDAVELTKRLGEQYLWIDCMSIKQDDPEDLSILIRGMNSIYEHAVLTIIAASGSGADATLAGVSSRSQQDVSPSGTEIVPCHNGALQLALAAFSAQDMLSRSKWATRGWTYQEHVLSPRCLCFTLTECFFTCDQGIWREAYHTSGEYRSTVKGESAYGLHRRSISTYFRNTCQRAVPANEVVVQYSLSSKKEQQSFPEYFQAVHDYTSRNLTFSSDIINAFAGMLDTFDARGILQHGLPLSFFEHALCWVEIDEAERIKPTTRMCRREPLKQGKPPQSRQISPTWSWAHWLAPVTYDVEHSWEGYLSLFQFDQKSSGTIVGVPRKQALYYKCYGYGDRLFQPVREMELPQSWSWRLGKSCPPSTTPPSETHNPMSLALWTQCLQLQLKYSFIQRRDDFRKYYEAYEAKSGTLLGQLKLFPEAVSQVRSLESTPFALISATKQYGQSPWAVLMMLLEREGFFERLDLGFVQIENWRRIVESFDGHGWCWIVIC